MSEPRRRTVSPSTGRNASPVMDMRTISSLRASMKWRCTIFLCSDLKLAKQNRGPG